MVNTRRHDPGSTRAALLEAASRLFARHGYSGTRTQAIAREAGVNKAMISYHFGGKAGLYEAVIAQLVDDFRPELADLRKDEDRPAPERLRRFVETLGESFARRPELGAIVLREHLSGGEHLSAEVMSRHVGEFFATTRSIVETGVAREELRPVDPHALHLSLIGSLVFFLASEPYRRRAGGAGDLPAPAPPLGEYIEHLVRLLVDGLRAEADTDTRR